MIHAHESKAVGWGGPRIVKYPTEQEVEAADRLSLVRWWRYLASPEESEQAMIIKRIGERLRETE